ncbi:hypothetical protein EJ05DRAFT_503123 [Pseudovirgaria hyperparasitica]|uniref:DUF202 domain-containing protein n=1 Tax=Pseudovirgaria hyperparasitica TaxID=470096 RepID=A0A6A6W0P7_9PEZI|nr:uncharacterized protein EJ05DRAFT_503123 [Pseudovirgaria hyperparasitica]KAF2755666.1 hypothetical protein EJ05DRAFT_503123 [Pseudovirgaria hyperparasitica]
MSEDFSTVEYHAFVAVATRLNYELSSAPHVRRQMTNPASSLSARSFICVSYHQQTIRSSFDTGNLHANKIVSSRSNCFNNPTPLSLGLSPDPDTTSNEQFYGFGSTSPVDCGAMFEGRRAQDRYHLRLHRARSVILTPEELVEIRAAQRTFEGAYIRTALGQFSFALIVLKVFTAEFYSIGALFAVYGAGILFTSLFRRQHGNKQFFSEVGDDGLHRKKLRTSGNIVSILTAISVGAYVSLLVLILKLKQ